jgi:Tfp pilus assembly protein PilV
MVALLLLATAATVLVQSQGAAIRATEDAQRIDTATMLARDLMTDLELRMEKEGFGELEVKENGEFNDERFAGRFEDYHWEYEVEKVDVEIGGLGNVMALLGQGQEAASDAAGIDSNVTDAAAESNPAALLDQLGFDFSIIGELLGNYVREARVRVCWDAGENADGTQAEDCVELITHQTNPTGQVTSAEEETPTP